jgi:hypothetical protein
MLTKQGLDFLSIDSSSSSEEFMFQAMAVWRTLGTSIDGSLVGNQVDKVAFEAAGATMYQAQGEPTRIFLRGRNFKVLK